MVTSVDGIVEKIRKRNLLEVAVRILEQHWKKRVERSLTRFLRTRGTPK